LNVPQIQWLVKHARENDSRVLLIGETVDLWLFLKEWIKGIKKGIANVVTT
jgi:hypothetical protein